MNTFDGSRRWNERCRYAGKGRDQRLTRTKKAKGTVGICVSLVLLLFTLMTGCTQKTDPVLSFEDHDVYQDEFLLYCNIVENNMTDRNDVDAVYQSAIVYAMKVYALYQLSAQLQLSEPFSYAVFQENLQQENEARRQQSQNGQPVMGVLEYEASDYLEYTISGCRYDISVAMAKGPSEQLLADAQQYYEVHKEDYISDATYQYQVVSIIQGEEVSEIKTLSYEQLTASYHSADVLGDILIQGEIGQVYHVGDEEITLLNRQVTYWDFSEIQEMVIMTYVEKEELDRYLEEYINTCEFSFDASQISKQGA